MKLMGKFLAHFKAELRVREVNGQFWAIIDTPCGEISRINGATLEEAIKNTEQWILAEGWR